MKKNYAIYSLLILFALPSFLISQVNKCGSAELHQQMMQTNAAYAQKQQAFEAQIATIQPSAQKVAGIVYKVPVVVHVMHKGEAVGTGINVSDEAIKSAIKDLNEMYRKIPGSQGDGNGVDVEIEYALAVRDENGNCTNGINRVDMTGNAAYMSNGVNSQSSGGITDAALKNIIFWNRTKYYNIWLISEIDNNNGGSGIQGYAYFASSHGTSVDGAVILAGNFTNGTSITAAHELGHSLNLYHTFEGDGTGASCPSASNGCGSGVGDCCGDIPPHKRSASDCVTGANTCDGGSPRDLFIHNYMDYSGDLCQNMFTPNQKARMIQAVSVTRASFLSPENGGTNLSLVPVATAGVDFSSSGSILCGIGQSISFFDKSSCIPNSYTSISSFSGLTHLWTITNGTNTYNSSLQNPVITFTNTGKFNVTLSITNSFGTTTLTKTGMIIVTAGSPVAGCIPSSNNTGNYWQTIYNTTFNSINSSTSKYTNAAYTDLACTYNTAVTSGSSYVLSISANAGGGSGNEVFEAYIDYNNNGIFSNPSELIFSGVATVSTSATFTTNVTIPATAVQNTLLRMRVIGELGTISASKRSCGTNFVIGDVEDYGVYIESAACTSPTITSTSPASRCSVGTVTVGATASSGTINWYSASTGGTPIATGTVYVTPSLTTTTIYYVDATSAGCTTASRSAITASVNLAPTTTLTTSSNSICAGESTTITASGASSYTWLPSGSGTSTVVSPTATTVYSVTGYNGSCIGSMKTITINVSAVPVVTLTTSSNSICAGQSTTITASGVSSYTWLPSGSGTSSIVSPTATTIYSVTGSNGSCVGSMKTITINVTPTPTTNITASSTTICAGQTTTLTANGATTYSWMPSAQTTTVITVTPNAATTYTVKGTSGSCSSTKTITINITTTPTVATSITNTTICSSNSVAVSLTGASTYSWLPSGSGATNTLTPASTTIYTVTGSNGSCNSTPKNFTVNVTPTPTTNIVASSTTICAGQTTTLTANGATTYAWMPSAQTTTVITVTPNTAATYTVKGTSGTCSSTKTITINITTTPTVATSITNTTICSSNSVAVSLTGASTYSWLPSGSGTTNTLTPASTTIYTVTGSNGSCISTPKNFTVNVTLSPTINVTASPSLICTGQTSTLIASGAINYTWSPATSLSSSTGSTVVSSTTSTTIYTITGNSGTCSDNKNVTLSVSTCTGIDNLISTAELLVYPNPSNGMFTISNTITSDKFDVLIINSLGQTIISESGKNTNQLTFDLSKYSKGIYYAKVTTTEGTQLFKLILE